MVCSDNQKHILLNLARESIREFLRTGKYIKVSGDEVSDNVVENILLEKRACFVSLHDNKGNLRGCIGTIYANDQLYKNIIQYAIYAATQDNRFDSIKLDEIDQIKIEISILSPLEPLIDIDDFDIGNDGLIIEQGSNSGLLLPQVALEWGFSKQEFLEQLCMKAGLEKNAYQDSNSKLSKFSAEIIRNK